MVTKSGGKFARDGGDWKLLHASCVAALRALHAGGYRIVIFRRGARVTAAAPQQRALPPHSRTPDSSRAPPRARLRRAATKAASRASSRASAPPR